MILPFQWVVGFYAVCCVHCGLTFDICIIHVGTGTSFINSFSVQKNIRKNEEHLVKAEKLMGVNIFQITCGKNCYFQVEVCELWLILEKPFGQNFSWEASFSASTGWKKQGEVGREPWYLRYFSVEMSFWNKVFNLAPQHPMSRMRQNVVIALHDQDKKDEQPKPQLHIFLGTC